MQTHSINIQELLLLRLIKFLNIAGPIAGFTAAISPLILFLLNSYPQYLNIGAIINTNQNQAIRLELADKKQQITRGLKFRPSLPKNQGMIFVFKQQQKTKISTNHIYLTLDIIFLKDGVVKSIIDSAPPCNLQKNCPQYDSIYPVNQIIQLPAGSIRNLDIEVGNKLDIQIIENS